MLWTRRKILRSVQPYQLAPLERDVLIKAIGLAVATSDDLCLKYQLMEWLKREKRISADRQAWLKRSWEENFGNSGCVREPSSVVLRQVLEIGLAYAHPSRVLPRTWTFPAAILGGRLISVLFRMVGVVGEIRFFGFERNELSYDYPCESCDDLAPAVAGPRLTAHDEHASSDSQVALFSRMVQNCVARGGYDDNVIIPSSPFRHDSIGPYKVHGPYSHLLHFSNGLKINDLQLFEVDGRVGVREFFLRASGVSTLPWQESTMRTVFASVQTNDEARSSTHQSESER